MHVGRGVIPACVVSFLCALLVSRLVFCAPGGVASSREAEGNQALRRRGPRQHANSDDASAGAESSEQENGALLAKARRRARKLEHKLEAAVAAKEAAEAAQDKAEDELAEGQSAAQKSKVRKGKDEVEERLPFLAFAIPTVPRRGKTYLRSVLRSFEAQVGEGTRWSDGDLRVIVMNMKKGEHALFEELRVRYAAAAWVEFVEVSEEARHPVVEGVGWPKVQPERRQERPDAKVKRQTLDVAKLLEHAAGRSRYLMLYEDDFELCPNGLLAAEYMVAKAAAYSRDFAAVRCSFGLAGIILHNTGPHRDVAAFAAYLRRHYARRPPDHLVVEWYAGEIAESREYFGGPGDRPIMAFRHNVLNHIGAQSTLRSKKHWSFPGCFEELVEPQVFAVEAWNPKDCPDDDLWPCDKHPHTRIAWAATR